MKPCPLMESLYIHFPFCETKCHYCDFYSIALKRVGEKDFQEYEEALLKEASFMENKIASKLKTIFFGGGTPSLTLTSTLKKLHEKLNLEKRITPTTEWTLEANPSSVHSENLLIYKKIGVNRISMGVQSLQNEVLKKMDRAHDATQAFHALDTVFQSFKNVSVDLLCGVPQQSLQDLEWNLDKLTSYPITHLSCYLLTLPQHHRMYSELPSEEEQISQLLFIHSYLKAKGFIHYEISNFCKPGFQAQHNLNYWKGASYLGLGPSAHSFNAFQKKRWKNISSLKKYHKMLVLEELLPIEWEETLTPEQENIERWMLALRLDEGFPKTWLETDRQQKKLSLFMKNQWITVHPQKEGYYRLTALGFTMSDSLIKEFVK